MTGAPLGPNPLWCEEELKDLFSLCSELCFRKHTYYETLHHAVEFDSTARSNDALGTKNEAEECGHGLNRNVCSPQESESHSASGLNVGVLK